MLRLWTLLALLLLPALVHAKDFNGMWVGYYQYSKAQGNQRVESAMVIRKHRGRYFGVMIEPQTFGDHFMPALPSYLQGHSFGRELVLFKRYDNEPKKDYDRRRRLRLELAPDGHTLVGRWQLDKFSGTARYRRVTSRSADRVPIPR